MIGECIELEFESNHNKIFYFGYSIQRGSLYYVIKFYALQNSIPCTPDRKGLDILLLSHRISMTKYNLKGIEIICIK